MIELQKYLHPILSGISGFLATIIGAYFFKVNNSYWQVSLGVLLFIFANHLLYKFKFNSYQLNGSTITTILIFISQVICLGLWKYDTITYKWIIGVFLIIIGTVLIEGQKNVQQKLKDQINKKYS